ncbi:MAG: phosphatidylglycerophosphatase [Aaplasma endosymbiont of Hyalomma asiaticum]
MLRSFFKLFVKLIGAIVPTRLVGTFMGIGHLPAWQEHWASLAVLMVAHILCYIVHGSPPSLANAAFGSGLVIAPFFLQVSIGLLVLGIVSIFICNNHGAGSMPSDVIVVQVAFGQLLTAALSMPATVALYESAIYIYNKVCIGIFMCPFWLNYFMHFLVFFIVPFLFFNIVIIIKPWPMSLLQLRCNNCVSVMAEGAVLAFYSVMIMYMIAFICVGLQMPSALKYMRAVILFAFTGPHSFS